MTSPRTPKGVGRGFGVRRLVTAFFFFAPGTRSQAHPSPVRYGRGLKESDDESSHSKGEPAPVVQEGHAPGQVQVP